MTTISVKAPLRPSRSYGYQMINSYQELVKQNLLNLLLTNPGERIMIPDFGVGVKRYLFEQNDDSTKQNLLSAIYKQVAKYLSYIRIDKIDYTTNNNLISLKLYYYVEPLGASDDLIIDIQI